MQVCLIQYFSYNSLLNYCVAVAKNFEGPRWKRKYINAQDKISLP